MLSSRYIWRRLSVSAVGFTVLILFGACKPQSSSSNRIAPVVDPEVSKAKCGFKLAAVKPLGSVDPVRDLKIQKVDIKEFLVDGYVVRNIDFEMSAKSKIPSVFVYKVCESTKRTCKQRHSNLASVVSGDIRGGSVKVEAWACRDSQSVTRQNGVRKEINGKTYYCGSVHSSNDYRSLKINKIGAASKKWAFIGKLDQKIDLLARKAYEQITTNPKSLGLTDSPNSKTPIAINAIKSVGPDHFAAMVKSDYTSLYQGIKDSEYLVRTNPSKYALADDDTCVPDVDPKDVAIVPPVEEDPVIPPPQPPPPADSVAIIAPPIEEVDSESGLGEGATDTAPVPMAEKEEEPFATEIAKCSDRDEWHRSEGTGQADWDSEYQVCWHTGETGQRLEIDPSVDPASIVSDTPTVPVTQAVRNKGTDRSDIFGGVFLGLGTVIAAGGVYAGFSANKQAAPAITATTTVATDAVEVIDNDQPKYQDLEDYLSKNGNLMSAEEFRKDLLDPSLQRARDLNLLAANNTLLTSKFQDPEFLSSLNSLIQEDARTQKNLAVRIIDESRLKELDKLGFTSPEYDALIPNEKTYVYFNDVERTFKAQYQADSIVSKPITTPKAPEITTNISIRNRIADLPLPNRRSLSRGGIMAGAAMIFVGGATLVFGLSDAGKDQASPIDYYGYQIYDLSLKRKRCLEKNICR